MNGIMNKWRVKLAAWQMVRWTNRRMDEP